MIVVIFDREKGKQVVLIGTVLTQLPLAEVKGRNWQEANEPGKTNTNNCTV